MKTSIKTVAKKATLLSISLLLQANNHSPLKATEIANKGIKYTTAIISIIAITVNNHTKKKEETSIRRGTKDQYVITHKNTAIKTTKTLEITQSANKKNQCTKLSEIKTKEERERLIKLLVLNYKLSLKLMEKENLATTLTGNKAYLCVLPSKNNEKWYSETYSIKPIELHANNQDTTVKNINLNNVLKNLNKLIPKSSLSKLILGLTVLSSLVGSAEATPVSPSCAICLTGVCGALVANPPAFAICALNAMAGPCLVFCGPSPV